MHYAGYVTERHVEYIQLLYFSRREITNLELIRTTFLPLLESENEAVLLEVIRTMFLPLLESENEAVLLEVIRTMFLPLLESENEAVLLEVQEKWLRKRKTYTVFTAEPCVPPGSTVIPRGLLEYDFLLLSSVS